MDVRVCESVKVHQHTMSGPYAQVLTRCPGNLVNVSFSPPFRFTRRCHGHARVQISFKCIVAHQLIRFRDNAHDDCRGSICAPLICVRSQTTDGHAWGHRRIISVWGRVEISEKPLEQPRIKSDDDPNPSVLKIRPSTWPAKRFVFEKKCMHCSKQQIEFMFPLLWHGKRKNKQIKYCS